MKTPGAATMMVLFFVLGLVVGLAAYFIPYMIEHYGHHRLPKVVSETVDMQQAAQSMMPKFEYGTWN